MKIFNIDQFNQEVDTYKLLSSTNGVGSLVSTTMGTFIMPRDIMSWHFIARANKVIDTKIRQGVSDISVDDIEEKAVTVIQDERFVNYLREHEGLTNLKNLISIPQMQLDKSNKIKVYEHPLFKKHLAIHPTERENRDEARKHKDDFVIPSIIFPRWLYSSNDRSRRLRSIEEWKDIWVNRAGLSPYEFAPPRDANSHYLNRKGNKVYYLLKQMPLVLICDKGHISDIPWDKYFDAYLEKNDGVFAKDFDLFNYTPSCNCHHELTYTESQIKVSGWGVLKCTKCNKVVSLEGVMNLKPKCSGEKPWLGVGSPADKCDEPMRVALLTSSGVYFADQVSSLYVRPSNGGNVLSDDQVKILGRLDTLYNKRNARTPLTKEEFRDKMSVDDVIQRYEDCDWDDGLSAIPSESDVNAAYDAFLNPGQPSSCGDYKTDYRYAEYEVFTKNKSLDIPKLKFKDIQLPKDLEPYFSKISQVDMMSITKTQLNFFRGEYPTVSRNAQTGKVEFPTGMTLYGDNPDKVYVYPACESLGEGLYFEFNEKMLADFADALKNSEQPNRYKARDRKMCADLSEKFDSYYHEEKFYLLHTFAHVLIKELEFSCGYPSASLAERIYYSDKMHGVLIYTVGSSEGSMGGLVWQGDSKRINSIIQSALNRACQCSSDPICWMHPVETLNFASCFSCTMIAETSCEYRNFGLDRQSLIDPDFGYFRKLI